MREGSSLTGTVDDLGAEAVTNLYIMDTNTAWRVTGNSMFRGTLANGGAVDYTASAGLVAVTVGNLADAGSTGGLFRMKTDIVNQKADNLIVTGTAPGSYLIDVINNGSGATTGNEAVPLVYIHGGGDEDFSLAHPVELGAWEYSLRETPTGAVSSVWELYANGNVTNPGVGGLDSLIGAYLLSYAETNTLIQRLGDLRGTKSESGLWFRLHGGEFESKSRRYSKGFDMDYYGIQLGYDRKVEIDWDGDAYFGVMFGYGKGDIDYPNNGGSDVESKMAGIYGTFVKPNGFFLDAIIKYQWMENDFDVPDSAGTMVHGKGADSNGFGWSVEVGQRIPFGRDQKTAWYAEPQVQLTYQRFGSGYYTASNGLHIGIEGIVSMTGRLGLLVGYEKENSNLYAKVSRVREFEGDLDVYANGSKLSESLSGSWWVYGIGYTARFDDRNSIYLDIERSSGGSFRHNWAAKAGWRYTF